MASRAVRWATAPGLIKGARGIAVLPQHGVVFVSSYFTLKLHAHRLLDGVQIASVKVPNCTFLASDPATATVYVSSYDGGVGSVVAYRWNGAKLVKEGTMEAAGTTGHFRPLAVIPPPPLACAPHTSSWGHVAPLNCMCSPCLTAASSTRTHWRG